MHHVLDLYRVADERRRDALIMLARHAREKGWWTKYADVFSGSFIELEADAMNIKNFEPVFVPGLLQTEDYARAVLRAAMVTTEVDRRVAARMERQRVLDRDNGPKLWAVVDDNALTRPVGGSQVMRAQLDHLIEARERENVTLQVIRSALGAHPGMNGPFVIMDFPHPDVYPPVVHLETATDGLYLEEPEEIARYTLKFDHLRAIALGPDESVRHIEMIKGQLGDQ